MRYIIDAPSTKQNYSQVSKKNNYKHLAFSQRFKDFTISLPSKLSGRGKQPAKTCVLQARVVPLNNSMTPHSIKDDIVTESISPYSSEETVSEPVKTEPVKAEPVKEEVPVPAKLPHHSVSSDKDRSTSVKQPPRSIHTLSRKTHKSTPFVKVTYRQPFTKVAYHHPAVTSKVSLHRSFPSLQSRMAFPRSGLGMSVRATTQKTSSPLNWGKVNTYRQPQAKSSQTNIRTTSTMSFSERMHQFRNTSPTIQTSQLTFRQRVTRRPYWML